MLDNFLLAPKKNRSLVTNTRIEGYFCKKHLFFIIFFELVVMATIIIGGFGLALAGSYFEKRVLPDMLPALFEPSTVMPALPRAFAGVVLVSVLSGFWITLYGLSVGSKRKASVFVCRRVRGVCSRARTCVTRSHALSATSNSSLPYQSLPRRRYTRPKLRKMAKRTAKPGTRFLIFT